MLFEAAFVIGLVALAFYGTIRLVTREQAPALPSGGTGTWRATHYDSHGATRVVLQKTVSGGTRLLDEHVVATIPLEDPEYDAKFMSAMATARERRAMFETEEE